MKAFCYWQAFAIQGAKQIMWIVRPALNRPYTFIVVALLILMLAPVVILRTPTDIFPNIDIPVIAVAWQCTGLNPQEWNASTRTSARRGRLFFRYQDQRETLLAGSVLPVNEPLDRPGEGAMAQELTGDYWPGGHI
jgi:hypothetical protein